MACASRLDRLVLALFDSGEPDCLIRDPGDGCNTGRIGEICNQ